MAFYFKGGIDFWNYQYIRGNQLINFVALE